MKIRNKIVQFLAFAAILCISYSCKDDFFTEKPGSKITPDDHYQSQKDLLISIIGTYSPLQKALPKLLLVDGLRSDLMDVTPSADVYMKEINDENISINNPYIDGSDYYKVIINVNEILKYIDKVYKAEPVTNPIVPHYTKGSLIAIRASCYFTLVKLYGSAALINDNLASLQAKQTVLVKKDMIDTLIKQLTPYVFNTTKTNELGLWGPNTKSLLGELYLENQKYDSAVFYLKLGMESFGNTKNFGKVTDTYQKEKWQQIFHNENGGEIIDLDFYDSHRVQNNDFSIWTTKYMVKPSQLLVDSFNAQIQSGGDVAGDVFRGRGATYDTLPGTNVNFISKYDLEKGDPYSTYIIISRAADIHLLLAEALLYKTGDGGIKNGVVGADTATAMLLLNTGISNATSTPVGFERWKENIGIRGRVNLIPRSIPANLNMSDAVIAIEDLIMDERALELAFEGKRWFDLVRVATRRKDPAYLANKVAAKFTDQAKAASVKSKLMDPSNWYLKLK